MHQRLLVILGLAGLLGGCASLIQGTTQPVSVAGKNNADAENTRCVFSNGYGQWTGKPGEPVAVHRNREPLKVECANPKQQGSAQADAVFKDQFLFLDLLLDFCILSCPIDAGTGAWHEYPASLPVLMRYTVTDDTPVHW